MKFPDDVHAELLRLFKRRHREWLVPSGSLEGSEPQPWPLQIGLGGPIRKPAPEELEGVQLWCLAWQQWRGVGELRWAKRVWAGRGEHQVPDQLIMRDTDEVTSFLRLSAPWKRAAAHVEELLAHWPQLWREVPRHYDTLAHCEDADFSRLVSTLKWLDTNPASLLYPRQLPIAGLDSKWIEQRKSLLTALVGAMRHDSILENEFHQTCGLRPLPHLVRMRVLDPHLRKQFGGLGDISVPVQQLAQLRLSVPNVLIVENLQTGLSLEDIPGTVSFMKLGYGVSVLGKIPWVAQARGIYWGDIDTHGFAILDQARRSLPGLESLLMDESTLLAHEELWGEEKEPYQGQGLSFLSTPELNLFNVLKENVLGPRLRLEQERLPWNIVCRVLRLL